MGHPARRRRRRSVLEGVAVMGLALLAAWPLVAAPTASSPLLVLGDAETGVVLLCRILPASGVTLAFDHSMYGGEVRERFVAAEGSGRLRSLRRVEATTANAAAAEYYAYDAPVARDGARFRIGVPPIDLAEVVVRVDRVGNHRLLIGKERLDLLPFVGDSGPLRLALAAAGDAEADCPGGRAAPGPAKGTA